MHVETHGANLVQLTRLRAVNAFLVREDDGWTLIDTLIAGSADDIIGAARAQGAEIVRIVLTHGHSDHAGSLEAVADRLAGAEVLVGAREARLLRGDHALDPSEPQARLKGMVTLSRGWDRELAAGDRVGSLEVVAAPGHTPGQIALLDTRDRTLIAGDAYSTLGGVATSAKPNPRFPFPALVTWHRPTALATARALRGLEPARLAVGHGRVVDDPGAEMDAAIAGAGG